MQIIRKLLFFLCLSHLLPAQTDTLIELPVVLFEKSPIRSSDGSRRQQTYPADSLRPNNYAALPERLAADAGIYFKSYGAGSLTTASVRGGAAEHTLVLWNGLPLTSPMLGQLDLSLLPLGVAENARLQKGGNSALWGSGAITGLIFLDNRPDFSQKLSVRTLTEFGSFEHRQQQFKARVGNEKFQSVSKVFYTEADNDFSYFVADNLPRRVQTNAALQQKNYLQDFYWKAGDRDLFSVHLWRQKSERQIPPTTVQNTSVAKQEDDAMRASAGWRRITKSGLMQGKIGWFDEQLNYFDEAILLDSRSKFQTLTADFTTQFARQNHTLQIGGTHIYTRAESVNYADVPEENKTGIFASYQYRPSDFMLQISLREELVNGSFIPVTPAAHVHYNAAKGLGVGVKVSRDYRLPTFNARYWRPGGNPDLLPESGWSQEIYADADFERGAFSGLLQVSLFHRVLDNRMLWGRREGENFFSAQNLTRVRSRGAEVELGTSYRRNDAKIGLNLNYAYTRSVNEVAVLNPEIDAGAQLFYVPQHRFTCTFSFDFKNINLIYRRFFNGKTTGIIEDLPAFQTADLAVQYCFKKDAIFVKIDNLWDADFFVIERRPQPGRTLRVGVTFGFAKNDSNNSN